VRFGGRHGAFAGVAVASLSPAKLAKFYESVNLGPDGAISLVGLDGVVRTSAGLKFDSIGRSMIGSELLRRAAIADEGFFTSRGTIDGITRLTSYRVVEGIRWHCLWPARNMMCSATIGVTAIRIAWPRRA